MKKASKIVKGAAKVIGKSLQRPKTTHTGTVQQTVYWDYTIEVRPIGHGGKVTPELLDEIVGRRMLPDYTRTEDEYEDAKGRKWWYAVHAVLDDEEKQEGDWE